jgi:hypothetical protein
MTLLGIISVDFDVRDQSSNGGEKARIRQHSTSAINRLQESL